MGWEQIVQPWCGWLMAPRDPVERFFESVGNGDSNECWPWLRARLPSGYGLFKERSYVQVYAHRYAYELSKGPIPDGLHIDHLCGNKWCVNPSHLDACSREENTRRHFRKMIVCQKGLHDMSDPDSWFYVKSRGTRRCLKCKEIADAARIEARVAA